MTRRLYDWVLHWAATPYGMVALAILAFAEASFFPIPPDVLLIAMCLGTPKRAWRIALLCSIASVVGGLAGYGIGYLAWGHVDHYFYAWVPGFSAETFGSVQELYRQWGIPIVFTAGFSPIPYKLFTITSGVMELSLAQFLLASAVSRSARFFLVAWLIVRFGDHARSIIDRYFNWLVLAFCVLLIGGFAAIKWAL
ncbi:MAG: cytochrome B [Deltaproteobacteria bacterium RIFOXYA12_FULL_58_15]|nr:MAG: cytochrome B [Deltaproteobacteria bacterium RIFOXYA12_FULL_58_15]OGR15095.1 MAG: cytochrome B [Deltaproteobacteria bacterium RIFOXYB12_FULL_58_9]